MTRFFIVTYGIAIGASAAAIAGSVDVTAVAIAGTAMPWMLPPLLMATYIVFGALLGAIIGGVVACTQPPPQGMERDAVRTRIQITCVLAVGGLHAANLIDYRWPELLAGPGIVTAIAAASAILVLAIGYALTRRREHPHPPADFAWQILCLAAAGLAWPVVHAGYAAPALSFTNIGIQAVFIGVMLGLYAAGRSASYRLRRRLAIGNLPATALCGTLASTIALIAALGMLWNSRPHSATAAISRPITTASQSTPPVILLVMDTVRADHLSVYDYCRNTTPHLAAFAEEAVVYKRAIAPASWTLPSHASMLTGLMPTAHGADVEVTADGTTRFHPLSDGYTTLAETLQGLGYDAGAVVANTVLLAQAYGLNQGFDYYDDQPRTSLTTAQTHTVSPARWILRMLQGEAGCNPYMFRSAEAINDRAVQWLNREARNPYFLFLNYMDAHDPYEPHPECAAQIASSVPGTHSAEPYNRIPGDMHAAVDAYDLSIAHLDAQIGRLFDVLRQRGDYDRSLIIVTADHGEAFGERGARGHGTSVFEEEVHVPLLVRYPQGQIRGIRREPVSLTIIPELVLDAIDPSLRASPECDLPRAPAQVLTELHTFRGPSAKPARLIRGHYSSGSLKTVFDNQLPHEFAVFDLQSDPDELFDRAAQHESHVAAVRTWTRDWESTALQQRLANDPALTDSAELRARLAALGYLGD